MNEILSQIPWGVIAPILVIQLLLVIIALVSCIRSEKTNGPKWLWILVILFINIIGPVLYFVIGRKDA